MLVLESNLLPPIPLSLDTLDSGGGLLELLKPSIRGELPFVGAIDMAPYGAPTPGIGSMAFLALLALAALGAYTLVVRKGIR